MLIHTDPFQVFDRFTPQVFGPRSLNLPMDAYRSADEFVVAFDLPGVEPESIDVTVDRNVLTVKAERKLVGGENVDVRISERGQGVFTRQLVLAENLDTERVEAHYDNGVLTLRIPVAELAKSRKIEITRGGHRQVSAA